MSSSSQVVESWISTYCSLLGHEYLAEVSEDFIEDDFNLTGLSSQIPMYKEALEMILDIEPEDESDEAEEEEEDGDDDDGQKLAYRRSGERRGPKGAPDILKIEVAAELLYGLIHQRYINSRAGTGQMHEKYEMGHFGVCPRILCQGSKVLPVGCSDSPGEDTVKLFCPSCLDIYNPPNSRFHTVDGAYFGTTFGSLFFMTYPELQLTSSAADLNAASANRLSNPPEVNGTNVSNYAPGLGKGKIYEPRIYGFRVAERARTGPRMKWLRQKPDDIRDLDESRSFHAEEVDDDHDEADDEEGTIGGDSAQQPQVESRKKAPMRRRRMGSGASGIAGSAGA